MVPEDYIRFGEMRMVMHHIYEFKKGIRHMVLCTLCPTCAEIVIERLRKQEIDYLVHRAGTRNINLFFGDRACLDAVSEFSHKPLNMLTPEEDYMLGTMLGYDITLQCRRFCERKKRASHMIS